MIYLLCALLFTTLVLLCLVIVLLWRVHQIETAVDIVADALLDIGSSVAETHKGKKENDN